MYLVAFGLWIAFFNYDALEGAPFYEKGIAPSGLFPIWTAMIFAVSIGAIVIHLLFDFWPMEILSFGLPQPLNDLISTAYIIALTFITHWLVLGLLRLDPVCTWIKYP